MKKHAHYQKLQGQLREIEQSISARDQRYKDLQKALREAVSTSPITKTTMWQYTVSPEGGFPEAFFYATPPVIEASESGRILITGTNCETRDMYKILEGLDTYQRVMRELQSTRAGKSLIVAPSAPQESTGLVAVVTGMTQTNPGAQSRELSTKPEYTFSSRVGGFWPNFFGNDHFLEAPGKNTIPAAIIGTGKMRNYSMYGGETLDVSARLEQIALDWKIPIQFIDSWAP